MASQGVFTIILNEKNEVLLVRRRDYPIWDLPGGRVEIGEGLIDAAIRETEEETGYHIKIDKKIGEYRRPQVQDTQHIYLGEIGVWIWGKS